MWAPNPLQFLTWHHRTPHLEHIPDCVFMTSSSWQMVCHRFHDNSKKALWNLERETNFTVNRFCKTGLLSSNLWPKPSLPNVACWAVGQHCGWSAIRIQNETYCNSRVKQYQYNVRNNKHLNFNIFSLLNSLTWNILTTLGCHKILQTFFSFSHPPIHPSISY